VPSPALGQISSDDIGQTLQISGQITDAFAFSHGWKYRLEDGSGTVFLLLWQNLYDQLEYTNRLSVGAQVSARGIVSEYLGSLEIVPQVPSDLAVTLSEEGISTELTPTAAVTTPIAAGTIPTATASAVDVIAASQTPTSVSLETPHLGPSPSRTAPPTPALETRAIGEISDSDVGNSLSIARAKVSHVDHFSAGIKYTLDDGTGTIILLVWQNVLEEISVRHAIVPGSQVRVAGRIEEYQGDLEIIPRQGKDLALLAQGDQLPMEDRPANRITAADEGRIFIVEGTVSRVEGAGWIKIWLQDGSGEVLVFVPERTVTYLPAGIGSGARLRVTGEVDVYHGVVELIPLAGADLEVR